MDYSDRRRGCARRRPPMDIGLVRSRGVGWELVRSPLRERHGERRGACAGKHVDLGWRRWCRLGNGHVCVRIVIGVMIRKRQRNVNAVYIAIMCIAIMCIAIMMVVQIGVQMHACRLHEQQGETGKQNGNVPSHRRSITGDSVPSNRSRRSARKSIRTLTKKRHTAEEIVLGCMPHNRDRSTTVAIFIVDSDNRPGLRGGIVLRHRKVDPSHLIRLVPA